jgi:hypothetical protein
LLQLPENPSCPILPFAERSYRAENLDQSELIWRLGSESREAVRREKGKAKVEEWGIHRRGNHQP